MLLRMDMAMTMASIYALNIMRKEQCLCPMAMGYAYVLLGHAICIKRCAQVVMPMCYGMH